MTDELCLREWFAHITPPNAGTLGFEAMADPKHEEHEQFMAWSGPFDPEKFDIEEATNEMREGLPDWRE
ncbi:MAG TPA: hypothetical protein VGM05_23920 [Planctomycetaceae bacterium]